MRFSGRGRVFTVAALAALALSIGFSGSAAAGGVSARANGINLFVYKVKHPLSMGQFKKKGVRTRVGCNAPCFIEGRIVTNRRTAIRLRLTSQIVGNGYREVGEGGSRRSMRIKLFPEVAAALRKGDSLRYIVKLHAVPL